MKERRSRLQRRTKETEIEISLDLDGDRQTDISTGLGFFDHMLSALAFHAGWNLSIRAEGDLHIDDHHTIEDCGIATGRALHQALGDKRGIGRFGHAYAPLDEALARCVIDLSGRPSAVINLGLRRETLGSVSCENLTHFFQSLAISARLTVHLDVLRGDNDHHRAESAFKSFALALRDACSVVPGRMDPAGDILSTKGVL